MGKEAQAMWDLFKEENPHTILNLDHTGENVNTIFVHSPVSNSHDEHTVELSEYIKEKHPKSKVGVGVMRYDGWKLEIPNAHIMEQEKENLNDSRRTKN